METYFANKSYINSQTTRIWAAENPHELHQVPLHTKKVRVWCTISRGRIIGPIFFDTTVTSAVYADTVQQFVALLNEDERHCWYQQDGATCHTSNETMTLLKQFFVDRIIIFGLLGLRTCLPPIFSCGVT
jgi:hypothetical protein